MTTTTSLSLTSTLNGKSMPQTRLDLHTTIQSTGATMVQLQTRLDSVLQLKTKVNAAVAIPFLQVQLQRLHTPSNTKLLQSSYQPSKSSLAHKVTAITVAMVAGSHMSGTI